QAQPVLTVRGIGDKADGGKALTDRAGWQALAAANAAAFAFALMKAVVSLDSQRTIDQMPRLVGSIPLRAGFFQHRLVARDPARAMSSRETAVISQVLTGLGGVGKTQLAADYARASWQSGDVDLIVWITATSREAIISGYAEAADIVDGGQRDVAD